MQFHTTSRRDDLISLVYLLIYMAKNGEMPGFSVAAHDEIELEFKQILSVKIEQKTKDLCFGNTSDF